MPAVFPLLECVLPRLLQQQSVQYLLWIPYNSFSMAAAPATRPLETSCCSACSEYMSSLTNQVWAGIFLMGYGLVAIPKHLWKAGDVKLHQQLLCRRAGIQADLTLKAHR